MKEGRRMYADAVIEGGGVKGIGLVGAIYEAEKKGYKWKRIAGTSAGAIIASMLAAGYTAEELKEEIMQMDYKKFVIKKGIGHIPILGELINIWRYYGIYSGDFIEAWVREKLMAKGIRTFGDLRKTLYIIASDITDGEILVLPKDITRYGLDPDSLDIAMAVRMSASLPYFFQPVKLLGKNRNKRAIHYIVDGAILSNYPVWIFDQRSIPKWPTFGFRLVSKKNNQPHSIQGPFSLGYALITTMLEAHDTMHIKEEDYVRSILVPSLDIKMIDFDISQEQSERLFISGVKAARQFFNQWNFNQYIVNYRSGE